jgi:HNH endonuclease
MSTKPHSALLLAVIGSPCPYCGQTMQIPDRPPSRDHIKPRSKGHALAGNLAVVCCRCNTDKGSLSLGQWLTRLSRAGDLRADHVETFMRARGLEIELAKPFKGDGAIYNRKGPPGNYAPAGL